MNHLDKSTCENSHVQSLESCHQNIFFIHGWQFDHVTTKLTMHLAATIMHCATTIMHIAAMIIHRSQQKWKINLNFKSLSYATHLVFFSYKYQGALYEKTKSLHIEKSSKHLFKQKVKQAINFSSKANFKVHLYICEKQIV
jgi:hypothetical protein